MMSTLGEPDFNGQLGSHQKEKNNAHYYSVNKSRKYLIKIKSHHSNQPKNFWCLYFSQEGGGGGRIKVKSNTRLSSLNYATV